MPFKYYFLTYLSIYLDRNGQQVSKNSHKFFYPLSGGTGAKYNIKYLQ